MQNMTICKQFNGVQDALKQLQCQKLECHKSDAKNCHCFYHQPPKVIRSPDMPTLCIDNAKYENLQAIQWSTRCFGVDSVLEFASPQQGIAITDITTHLIEFKK
jgi:hypothetical protein